MIKKAREHSNHHCPIHYCNIGKKHKPHYSTVKLVTILLDIVFYIIQQQKIDAVIKWDHKNFDKMMDKIGAKLAVFRDKESLLQAEGMRYSQKRIEATFRMGLKGAIHYLFKDEFPCIDKIYFDCDDQHFHKTFDVTNMWDRLKRELKDNIDFTENSIIFPFGKISYKLDCEISQLMQLTDVIIGAFRTVAIQDYEFHARYTATYKIRELLLKDIACYARMLNSRFFKGYTITEAFTNDGDWLFEPMKIQEDKMQLDLFDF